MPNFRCTAWLQHAGQGWTESYYNSASSFSAASEAFSTLWDARMALSPPTVKTKALRVYAVDTPRASLIVTPSSIGREGTYEPSTELGHINLADDTVLIEIIGTERYKNRKFLRGMPDDAFSDDTFSGSTTWITAYGTGSGSFKSVLTGGGWRCRNKDINPPHSIIFTGVIDVRIVRATLRRVGAPFAQRRGRRTIPSAP